IALVLPAGEDLGIVALGVKITLKKAVRIKAEGIALDQRVKLALLAGSGVGHGIEGLQGHLETHAVPLLLDDLRTLTVESGVGVPDALDRGDPPPGRLEYRLGLFRVIFQAVAAFQVPGVARRIGLIEHGALAVEHRVVDSIAVDGVRRGSAQALVLEWSLAEV